MLNAEKSGLLSVYASDITPFPDFLSAATAVLQGLRERFPFDMWIIARMDGQTGTLLACEGVGYDITPGQQFPWAETCCHRMLNGLGPRIAPVLAEEPAYASVAPCQVLNIQAYIGVPLSTGEGRVFGTLCAIHRSPMPQTLLKDLPKIEAQARLISSLLAAERNAAKAREDATTDTLTGLLNRRGWAGLISTEEARCRRYGSPACVVVVDLDGLKHVNDTDGHAAGDELINRAARALKAAARATDSISRVGGDEFAVLAVETDEDAVVTLVHRIRAALAAAGVLASLGVAPRETEGGLEAAWEAADAIMYSHKRRRHQSGTVPVPARRMVSYATP